MSAVVAKGAHLESRFAIEVGVGKDSEGFFVSSVSRAGRDFTIGVLHRGKQPQGRARFLQRATPVGSKRCFWNVTTIYLTVPSEVLTKGAASEKRVVLGFTLGTV